MKTISGLFILLALLFHPLFITPVSALEIEDRNEYLMDARGDDGDIYLNRLLVTKKLDSPNLEISAFGETQWNFDTDDWEKLLLGVNAGTTLYKYFRISQSVQMISGQMLDHISFNAGSTSIDTTTRFGLYLPFAGNFSFQLYEEYSVNLEEARDEYCETVAEFSYKPRDLFSLAIGWRHTDRIHNFDSDYISSSLTLHF